MFSEKVDANERLRSDQQRLGLPPTGPLPFLCECGDVACREIIRLTVAEYSEVRESPDRCVCVAGHPYEGRVVTTGEGYVIAEER